MSHPGDDLEARSVTVDGVMLPRSIDHNCLSSSTRPFDDVNEVRVTFADEHGERCALPAGTEITVTVGPRATPEERLVALIRGRLHRAGHYEASDIVKDLIANMPKEGT